MRRHDRAKTGTSPPGVYVLRGGDRQPSQVLRKTCSRVRGVARRGAPGGRGRLLRQGLQADVRAPQHVGEKHSRQVGGPYPH